MHGRVDLGYGLFCISVICCYSSLRLVFEDSRLAPSTHVSSQQHHDLHSSRCVAGGASSTLVCCICHCVAGDAQPGPLAWPAQQSHQTGYLVEAAWYSHRLCNSLQIRCTALNTPRYRSVAAVACGCARTRGSGLLAHKAPLVRSHPGAWVCHRASTKPNQTAPEPAESPRQSAACSPTPGPLWPRTTSTSTSSSASTPCR